MSLANLEWITMKHQSLFRWLDRVLVIGIIVSVVIALLLVLTGNDTILGLVVGLLSLIITLLLEVIARFNKLESLLAEAVTLSKILSDDSLQQPIRDIVNYYESIAKYEHDEFLRHTKASIEQCRAALQEIASGVVRNTPKGIQEAGFREFERVQRDVKAIHVDPMNFWTGDWGRKYFAINQTALKRGVKVTRIFALTDTAARDNIETLKEQERAGVRVLILDPGKVITEERLIFDERILVYYEKYPDGSYKTENIVLDPIRVKRELKEFEQLASHPYVKSMKDVMIGSKSGKGG